MPIESAIGRDADLTKQQVALASDAWEALLRAYTKLNRAFLQEEHWGETTMREYDILYSLARTGRGMTQRELLSAVALSQPAVSRMLMRMEDRGLILRIPSAEDARSTRVQITGQGLELQRRIGRLHGKHIARVLHQLLDAGQMRQMKALCDDICSEPSKAVGIDHGDGENARRAEER